MAYLVFALSLALLVYGSHRLVFASVGLAHSFNIPPLVFGLTFVALSTSLPEIMIAISASWYDKTDIAVGNAIGSNIANIGLVLGLTSLVRPLRMHDTLLRREFPILFIAMLLTYSLMFDGYIGVLDSCIFLLFFTGVLLFLLLQVKRYFLMVRHSDDTKYLKLNRSRLFYFFWFIVAGTLVPLASIYLIESASVIAHHLGVSDLLIALTILAIGSSIPELTTSLIAAFKGADELAVGNILGANIFNLVAVMVFPGLIHPSGINHAVLWRDLPVMFALTLLLMWFNYRHRKQLRRWQGGLLVALYFAYMTALVLSAYR